MKISASCYMLAGFGFTPPWSVNAGFIVGGHTTLLVDTGPSAMAARTILGYARAARPVNLLRAINTEQHLDHMLGNCVFADEHIDITGHAAIQRVAADLHSAVAELNAAIPELVRRQAGEAQIFFADTRVVNPTIRIDSETGLDLGELAVRIIPAPGHTPSNLLVWAEAEGVLFTGDTLVSGYIPNLDSGTPADWRRWQEALARIQSLQPAILVPGHGPCLTGAAISETVDRINGILESAIHIGNSPTAQRR
jgi:glyoxylase-like metal-dependent hydrolase (beta-lactamase superfamily II)